MRKLSYLEVKNFIEDSGCKLLSEEYINSRTKIQVECFCGNTNWFLKFNDFYNGRKSCPLHAEQKRKLSYIKNHIIKVGSIVDTHFEIVKQWDYLKNNGLLPENFSYGSIQYIWWICEDCNFSWFTSINARTNSHTDCPNCADKQKESRVATECKEYFQDNYNAVPEYKLFKNPDTNQWLRCDIYIPDNIFIEIHGRQHNQNDKYFYKTDEQFEYRQHLDLIKKQYCQENGLYIEVDLRKIKTTDDAIVFIEQKLQEVLQCT